MWVVVLVVERVGRLVVRWVARSVAALVDEMVAWWVVVLVVSKAALMVA